VACGTQRGNAYRVLMGKDGGKRLFERPRNRREDNIKLILLKWDGWARI
jgi:hypothetical protein